MRTFFVGLAVAWAVSVSGNSQTPTRVPVVIIEVGIFHGEDIPELPQTQFTGLFRQGDSYVLAMATVSVAPAVDELVDKPGEMTGKEIKIAGPGEAIFAISGNPMANMGSVRTASAGQALDLLRSAHTWEFLGQNYKLGTVNAGAEESGFKGAQLQFSSGSVNQVLFELPEGGDDPGWTLMWAGDLDGDGKLDLYMDVSDHYNVSEKRLFLSSLAKDGELVREVAVLRTVGC